MKFKENEIYKIKQKLGNEQVEASLKVIRDEHASPFCQFEIVRINNLDSRYFVGERVRWRKDWYYYYWEGNESTIPEYYL